jgi:predicted ABC-class ATPase
VTLVCGGAFHGKSTLLDAIATGIHDHVRGDGRELCVTVADATLHRAEPGRWVPETDLRAFFGPLPGDIDPARFRSENASGSTSQAASILEGIEAGSHALLFDEDTSAGNLLAQDAAMRALLGDRDEPIVHLSRRLRQLHRELGVSTILVLGGSGAPFSHADRVIQMVEFQPRDVTAAARSVAETRAPVEAPSPWPARRARRWRSATLRPGKGRREIRVRVHGGPELELGSHRADLRAWPQIADPGQLRAIGAVLGKSALESKGADIPIRELLDRVEERLASDGLEWARGAAGGELARFRAQDLLAVLTRLRGCELAPESPD